MSTGRLASCRSNRHSWPMRRLDKFSIETDQRTPDRACDAPGCTSEGLHRAPRSRETLNQFFWFCLDHVREYNRTWNYCAGMNEHQIERAVREDTVWRRPTWPLGNGRKSYRRDFENGAFRDPFDLGEELGTKDRRARELTPEQHADFMAFRTMDLVPPVTLTQLKTRYKELVKRHHPDVNGGDNSAEERLKDINEAYTTLKKSLAE